MADPTHKEIGGKGDERAAELGLGKMEKNISEVPEGSGEKGSNINTKEDGVQSQRQQARENSSTREEEDFGGYIGSGPFFLLFLFRF